ncbi:Tm-1-like ATP-binding domain-containing protein [Oricola sp.]|uniref:Tm-1-like ATP-binding domain-containing protein n=1 Tax=Oricola sp. TaxID=1979950 RepID=UPI003BAB50B8
MGTASVLVLATLETKAREAEYLIDRLKEHGAAARIVDISLNTGGVVQDGPGKLARMNATVAEARNVAEAAIAEGCRAVVGIGGGTGGEICIRVMRALPITFPKVLVTTLPFDPRAAVAESSIILVPTLADISGLNTVIREVLGKAAVITAGLSAIPNTPPAPSIGITGLGANEAAVAALVHALDRRGEESTVFHSNGYGGAAFARFAAMGAFWAIVDMTPHELTRIHLAGARVDMPGRFTAAADLPRLMLPGALNFLGLGELSTLPATYRGRPHYAHSGFFTHVKLEPDEMRLIASELAKVLNAAKGPTALIVPMGGFSHQDCPGGAIEDGNLRQVFLDQVRQDISPRTVVHPMDAHISAPEVTETILASLDGLTAFQTKADPDV